MTFNKEMSMKNKLFSFYIIFLLLLSACTAEDNLSPEKSGRAIEIEIARTLRQDESSRASPVTVAEDQINSLWVAFYNKVTGERYGDSFAFSSSDIRENKVKITTYDASIIGTEVDVVVVANPDAILLNELKNSVTRDGLNELKTAAYTDAFPTYACMYGTVRHTFTNRDLKATVSQVRLPVKMEITCDKRNAPNITKIISYVWENIPVESYLMGSPSGSSAVNRGIIYTNALQEGKGLGYPYEYGKDMQRGKVKIRAQKYNGDICYYYFLLPEEIKRNHWYKFMLKLVADGGTEEKPEEVQASLIVEPWTESENSVNIGDIYLECPRDMSLYVRTQGIVVNPERSFVFHTNVGIGDCKVESTGGLLYCEINPVPGGGRIDFRVKEGVFQEFHPRVKTTITITAGNISRKVDVMLIPLIEIHPQRPNVIMVWPGHEFYYNSAKHGGLYVHTPLTPEGYANNQQEEPNMCQMFEVYNQDYYESLNGRTDAHLNYDEWIGNQQFIYYEDFCGWWDILNGCKRYSKERVSMSCAEKLGNGWRCPTEYELRAMYQAWAHFGRPKEQGGNEEPPIGYKTPEEKALYNKTRKFYKRFYNGDTYRPYGCTTFKSDGGGCTVAQFFKYNWNGNTWVANPYENTYGTDKTVIIRPVRDYVGSETTYDENTWYNRDSEAKSGRR